ncbi:MAG: aspartate carbamoyltransferase catalytic subunit [Firmicutes bacterium]|nr:aspartate carbamoyltransferase catalytic subunit [Bacillota bacterium]
MKTKNLLGLKELSAQEITEILDAAAEFKKILVQNVKKTPHLAGKSVTTLFYENSTRTRLSFETAAKYLGANCSSVSVSGSSIQKGETLIDTGLNLDALLTDVIVLRHPMAGAPHLLAKNVKAAVINGGDGLNEHPTQALLDIFTLRESLGKIKGLKVAILGDIKFSRVARSNAWGLSKLGASVTFCAPKTLLPAGVEDFPCRTLTDAAQAVKGADAVMGLRIQSERQKSGMFPSVAEYAQNFGITESLMRHAKKNALILHPGPMNRGIEIDSAVADAPNSVILPQVTNGVAIRMAVLYLLTHRSIN